jgi:hypothetical protein
MGLWAFAATALLAVEALRTAGVAAHLATEAVTAVVFALAGRLWVRLPHQTVQSAHLYPRHLIASANGTLDDFFGQQDQHDLGLLLALLDRCRWHHRQFQVEVADDEQIVS